MDGPGSRNGAPPGSDRPLAGLTPDQAQAIATDWLGRGLSVVRWSDDTEGNALQWYADELLVCEFDLIGKTQSGIRLLPSRCDRDWLQS